MLHWSRTAQADGKSRALLSGTNLRLIILATALVSLSACDPVRTIRHVVRVEVTDDHGAPRSRRESEHEGVLGIMANWDPGI